MKLKLNWFMLLCSDGGGVDHFYFSNMLLLRETLLATTELYILCTYCKQSTQYRF